MTSSETSEVIANESDSKERPGVGKVVNYIKPGLGRGGATFSDLMMLEIFKETGAQVNVFTGHLVEEVRGNVESVTDNVEVIPVLDRRYDEKSGDELVNTIMAAIDQKANQSDILLFSQPFSGDAPYFAEAVSRLAAGHLYRSHDPVRTAQPFTRLGLNSKVFPTTRILARQMRELNKDVELVVLPPCIDDDRLQSSDVDRIQLRKDLLIEPDDFMILQPTRVDPNKRIDKAVWMAAELNSKLGDRRQVQLVVTGTAEEGDKTGTEKERLQNYASTLGYSNLKFENGVSRIGDYMRAADLVTFMSEREGWGMPPAEAAYLGLPCVVSPYVDQFGQPIYEEVYGKFNFIKEPIGGDPIVSQNTLDSVMELIRDPNNFSEARLNNRVMTIPYTKETLRKTIFFMMESK